MKKNIKLKLRGLVERIVKEEIGKMKPVRIKYTPITKRIYATYDRGIEFEVEINGKKARGFWRPVQSGDPANGVDVNELRTPEGTITIFTGGGGYRYYEIAVYKLPESPKQPKDLRFTGPYLSIDSLKPTFVNVIQKALNNPHGPAKLTDKFLKYFNLTMV